MNDLTQEEIILSGLSGTGRGSANGEIGASIVRRHFLERMNTLPKEVRQKLRSGKAKISDVPFYATGQIQGTRAELIKLSASEELGTTNIDNGKLGKDRYMTLSGFQLLYDADDVDGKYTSDFPAELINGEWEFEVDGAKLFEKQRIRDFFDGFYGYNINLPFGMKILDNPKTIYPQLPMEFNVSLPGTVAGFLKVNLIGTYVYG